MKRILLLAVAVLLFAGCSSDDEPKVSEIDKEISAVLQVLNGHFTGEVYSETLNTTEHWEYTFTPYQSPKSITNLFAADYKAHGTVHISHYFNDHLLQVDNDSYYTVVIAYKGATPKLSLYQHNSEGYVTHQEQTIRVTVVSSVSLNIDGVLFTKEQ